MDNSKWMDYLSSGFRCFSLPYLAPLFLGVTMGRVRKSIKANRKQREKDRKRMRFSLQRHSSEATGSSWALSPKSVISQIAALDRGQTFNI